MKAEELNTKTPDELNKLLLDLRKEQFNMRIQRVGGQLENTSRFGAVRKDIARIKTILTAQKSGKVAPAAKTAKKKSA